jgi:hypothetical protein
MSFRIYQPQVAKNWLHIMTDLRLVSNTAWADGFGLKSTILVTNGAKFYG